MASKQDCLRHAAELVRSAHATDDPDVKSILIEMATGWRRLADWSGDEPEAEVAVTPNPVPDPIPEPPAESQG